jgi:hypothetical protein
MLNLVEMGLPEAERQGRPRSLGSRVAVFRTERSAGGWRERHDTMITVKTNTHPVLEVLLNSVAEGNPLGRPSPARRDL